MNWAIAAALVLLIISMNCIPALNPFRPHTVCNSRHCDDIKSPSIDEKKKVDAATLPLAQLPRYRDTGTAKPYVNGVERNNAAFHNQRIVLM